MSGLVESVGPSTMLDFGLRVSERGVAAMPKSGLLKDYFGLNSTEDEGSACSVLVGPAGHFIFSFFGVKRIMNAE